jgi:hypothetical protein
VLARYLSGGRSVSLARGISHSAKAETQSACDKRQGECATWAAGHRGLAPVRQKLWVSRLARRPADFVFPLGKARVIDLVTRWLAVLDRGGRSPAISPAFVASGVGRCA